MIIFSDFVLGTPDDPKTADKVSKFFEKYRDRKNELAFWSSAAQEISSKGNSHLIDSLGSFHYSSGSEAYDYKGMIIQSLDYWDEEDKNDPESDFNKLLKHIQNFHKLSGYESDTDDFNRGRCDPNFFIRVNRGILTYYPYGPNPDVKEWDKYVDFAAKNDEINKFIQFLNDKGFKARLVRGGSVDIDHVKFDPKKSFESGPLKADKYYLFTNSADHDIINFPEGTELYIGLPLEEVLTEVANIMKETKK